MWGPRVPKVRYVKIHVYYCEDIFPEDKWSVFNVILLGGETSVIKIVLGTEVRLL